MEIVDEMLMRINERYHCDLSKNLDLRISLGLHTVPLLKRLQFHVVCHNPLLEEIQMNYLQAYDFALCACEVIGRRYQCTVAADEIAYYAVHFKIAMDSLKKSRRLNILIVCTSGRATSQLLRINFLKYFQDQLDQADTCNLFELSTRNLSRYDCVFSTVPIQKTLEIPVFQIKTFFDGERIKNIGQVFQEIIQENDDVFRRELFFHDITAADKESVLKEITERIGKCRPLPETFLASVLERESMQSTGFGCVALPHTHGAICEENLVSCTVLPEPVEWGNGKVQIVILTSYNHDFIKEHDLFFEFILELIKNQQYRRSLIEDPRYETLIRIFSDYRNEENNGK
jgi:lichenan operon transcriptional antiterminator